MTFEIGSWVKWGGVCPTRLGHEASEIGRVVNVHEFDTQGFEIDVEFDNGEVVRGALAAWFEPAAPRREHDTPLIFQACQNL
ncbi:MAG: hypothetical protein ACLP7P_20340 [Rhodomicrobium sp.]